MARRTLTLVLVAGGLLLAASTASGNLLWNDPQAMAGWSGTQEFFNTDGDFTIHATVQYAVYAPGQYAGVDPSGGTEYVYAYQVFNTSEPGVEEISKLSIGISLLSGAHNIQFDSSAGAPGLPGGIDPSNIRLSGSSARWNFDDNTIFYGGYSTVLLFTSAAGPRWASGSIQDGGLADTRTMPSPSLLTEVPEPMTLVLLAAGALCMVTAKGRGLKLRRGH